MTSSRVRPRVRGAGLSILTFALLVAGVPLHSAGTEPQNLRPVLKASCGPQDRTETVQGQTTFAERFAPGPAKAFNCNLELIGQFEGEGAGADVAALDACAYYSTSHLPLNPKPGVMVLKVEDPRSPQALGLLTSPAMRGAHESIELSPARNLMLASVAPDTFDTYDLSKDCGHPVLIKSQTVSGLYSHNGQFTTDGLTYYGAKWPAGKPTDSVAFALDASDPANLRTLATWVPEDPNWITHNAAVSADGNRVYVTLKRMAQDWENSPNPNGLVIFDSSDSQARKPNAKFRLISSLFWRDSHGSEGLQLVTIKGRPYLVFSDNLGALGYSSPAPAHACDSGIPGQGFARIIDISDEQNPRTVSRLMLEAGTAENCKKVRLDPTTYGGYGSIACTVDNSEDSRLLACGSFEAGLRVFDIRDPLKVREVAYYKPPARRTERRLASLFAITDGPGTGAAKDHTADSVLVAPIFRNNAQEIWFTSADNGFQVVRFSDRFKAAHADLFSR